MPCDRLARPLLKWHTGPSLVAPPTRSIRVSDENQNIRAILEEKLAVLKARHQRIDDHLHNRNTTPSQDWAERAVELENEEVVEALEPMTRRDIEAIEAALTRLDNGQAPVCARCDEPIPSKRLAILPATPFCANCAA